jgi:hypothetical protein
VVVRQDASLFQLARPRRQHQVMWLYHLEQQCVDQEALSLSLLVQVAAAMVVLFL